MFSVCFGRKTKSVMRRTGRVYTVVACAVCFLLMHIQQSLIQESSEGSLSLEQNSGFIARNMPQNEIHNTSIPRGNFDKLGIANNTNINSHVPLIIVVCSHPEHVQVRQTIRSTWANEVKDLFGVQVVFLLGVSRDESWRELTRREMVLHGDIVQVDVAEDYRNLAGKVIMGMRWVSQNAPHVSYYMKCDDDVYINLPYLLQKLSAGIISSNQILGALSPSSPVIRDPRDEWSVPYDVFPAKTFPPYVAGGSYVMSMSALTRVLSVVPSEPQLHLEDVYITGILAQKASLSHVGHGGFSFWSSPKAKPCDIISNRVIASVNMSAKRILKLHSQISELMSHPFRICLNSSSTYH